MPEWIDLPPLEPGRLVPPGQILSALQNQGFLQSTNRAIGLTEALPYPGMDPRRSPLTSWVPWNALHGGLRGRPLPSALHASRWLSELTAAQFLGLLEQGQPEALLRLQAAAHGAGLAALPRQLIPRLNPMLTRQLAGAIDPGMVSVERVADLPPKLREALPPPPQGVPTDLVIGGRPQPTFGPTQSRLMDELSDFFRRGGQGRARIGTIGKVAGLGALGILGLQLLRGLGGDSGEKEAPRGNASRR